jgi:hypothetical protein
MSSTEIQKQIDILADEVSDLKSRKKSLSNELESLTEGLASDWDDSNARNEIRDIKSDKDILSEVISRKETKLAELEEKLAQAVQEEQAKESYQALINLAEQAEELEESYRKKIDELDGVLRDKISGIVDTRSQWRKTAIEFMNLADRLGKGFKQTTNYSLHRQGKEDEIKRDELIERLENDGIDPTSAMSNTVLKSEYYAMTRNGKPLGNLAFIEAIQAMCNQRNIPELIEE